MSPRGSLMPGKFSLRPAILVILLGTALIIYLFLKKRTIINNYEPTLRIYLITAGFNMEMIKILTAQAAHETGNFTSKVFLNNNNLFGMRFPKVRKTTAKKELNNYAYYDNVPACISDMLLYLDYIKLNVHYINILALNPLKEYVRILKEHNYFEDTETNYYNGCLRYYNLYYGKK